MISAAATIIELDPALLAPSPFSPRADETTDSASFLQLFDSIRQSGQQVPILVARDGDGFVCVYGHRRVRVAELLETTVKAIVGDLGPLESLLAQGLENSGRLELTFIEKARFAWRLHKDGLDAELIARTMAVDATAVSRFLKVAGNIDPTVLDKIGRAPKIGRPRWISLANEYEKRPEKLAVRRAAYKALEEKGFDAMSSDRRFEKVRRAISGKTDRAIESRLVMSSDNRVIAQVRASGDGSHTIKIEQDRAEFATALVEALPWLFSAREAGMTLQVVQNAAPGSAAKSDRRQRGSSRTARRRAVPAVVDGRAAPGDAVPPEASTTVGNG